MAAVANTASNPQYSTVNGNYTDRTKNPSINTDRLFPMTSRSHKESLSNIVINDYGISGGDNPINSTDRLSSVKSSKVINRGDKSGKGYLR